jgi:hypothetical protein
MSQSMDEFIGRQLAQLRFAVADFRGKKMRLSQFLSRLEGVSRAMGDDFWERQVFKIALELEQINADLVEERRMPTAAEDEDIESLLKQLDPHLGAFDT